MEINRYIDHTLLRQDAAKQEIEKLCAEAREHGFFAVCVNPCRVSLAKKLLASSDVRVCTVIGFPLGACKSEVKAFEADAAVRDGADEVDMVINVGLVKDGEWTLVQRDIEAVTAAVKGRALVKVIIEACLLTDEEKVLACKCAERAGADFVKTSTGFSRGGATVEDVLLMRGSVSIRLGVKAAGGVRSLDDAKKFIEAGAARLGASAGVSIAEEEKNTERAKKKE